MSGAKSKRQLKQCGIDGMLDGIPIRKLFVSPMKPQVIKGIKRYFQQFGEVESVYVSNNTRRSSFGFVQFKSSDAAKKVMSKSAHRVVNISLIIKPAHAKYQPDYKTFKPPKHDSPQHILNALNDDCLRVIFGKLKLVDLSVAAEVCVRFQEHAKIAFQSKYKQSLEIDDESKLNDHPDKLKVCLRNFGEKIHTLSIDENIFPLEGINILEIMNEHMPALKDLTLRNFHVDVMVESVHPLLAKLQALALNDCNFSDGAEELLVPFTQLKRLRLDNTDWDNNFIGHQFPQLEEFVLDGCSSVYVDEFKKFIRFNPTLQKLTVRDNEELKSSSIIQSISGLKKLVELEFDQKCFDTPNLFAKCTLRLSALKSLQKLTLNNHGFTVSPLLFKLADRAVPLENLTLKKAGIDDKGIKKVATLKNLNTIVFDNIENLTDDHMNELTKELPQLRIVHCLGSSAENITTEGLRTMLKNTTTLSYLILKRASNISSIDNNDYRAMLQTVLDRPEQKKLNIELSGGGDKLKISDHLMSVNREWLHINEEVEDDDDDDDFIGARIICGFNFMNILGGIFRPNDSSDDEDDNSASSFDLD